MKQGFPVYGGRRRRTTANFASGGSYTRGGAVLARKFQRLHNYNRFLREAFAQALQSVALTNREGRIIHTNSEFSRTFGYSYDEVRGRYLSELVVPPEASQQWDRLLALAAQGQAAGAETISRRKEGIRFPAAVVMVPFFTPGEAALRVTWTDLTATKAAEEAGTVSEGRWRAVFDNSAVGIALTDGAGRFIATNRAYQNMVGYSEAELLGLTYLDLTFEDDRAANVTMVEQLEMRGGRFQMEKRCRRKDGSLIWVRITVSRSTQGTPATTFGMAVVEDIQERRLAEDRLREYQRVVESAREMIVVVDREYRLSVANRAYLNYRGLRREEVIGRPIDEVAGPAVIDGTIKGKLDECFLGRAVEFELKCKHVALGERDLVCSLFPIEGGGSVSRAAAFIQDITVQKRSREDLAHSFRQLRALTAQLQSVREEERTRLARELHDELGQALTGIKIELAALRAPADQPGLPPSAAERIASMMTAVDRTIHSVRRIATDLRTGVLDDLGLIAAAEWMAEDFEERTGIRCLVSLPAQSAEIDPGCATAVFRILQEALTNVARHAGASIVEITLATADGELSLTVQDNGSGIPDTMLSRAGSLGLLGMRERVLLLGGSFEIGTCPEGGTIVTVRIPLPHPERRDEPS